VVNCPHTSIVTYDFSWMEKEVYSYKSERNVPHFLKQKIALEITAVILWLLKNPVVYVKAVALMFCSCSGS
jgi:hypothetical protein